MPSNEDRRIACIEREEHCKTLRDKQDKQIGELFKCVKKKVTSTTFKWIIGILCLVIFGSYGFSFRVLGITGDKIDTNEEKIHQLDKNQVTEEELESKLDKLEENINNKFDNIEHLIRRSNRISDE